MSAVTKNATGASRRRFLKTIGGAASGYIVAPFIGGVRRANAAHGSAVACIRFYLSGGARTSVLWDSNHTEKYNPYGLKYTTPPSGVDADFLISNLWPDNIMEEILPDISVVRTVYHGDGVSTSHEACRQRILTGGTDLDLPGWSSVVNREFPSSIPSVLLGGNPGAGQLGSLGAAYTSLMVPNAQSVARLTSISGAVTAEELRRIKQMRDAVSLRTVQQVSSSIIRDLPFHQDRTRQVVSQLSSPYFNITAAGDSAFLGIRMSDGTPLTNGELKTLFEINVNGAGNGYNDKTLMALRLIQSGARAITITNGGWDTHGDEAGRLRNSLPRLGKALHSLISTLKDLPSLSGTKANALQDVLIVVDTEFGRDNTGENGFNSSSGSDHNNRYAKYFSVMFAGGGVTGGRAIGATDVSFSPVDGITYHSSRINATIYDLLGVSRGKYLSTTPIEELYI
ncbi:hypothetical protein MNBD_GAMMA09-2442 [hydrothermal vent metagenome]|uniref:DUF1501 domain-containing protein n=1 Tax=hydrothermal vent metagenome TaxID=652676 RepID=A0A3B0Y5B8_9ZZZZ